MTHATESIQPAVISFAAHALVLQHRGRLVVDRVSMAFEGTGAVALIGPNGAGKSSLLTLLAGLQVPHQGNVLCNGQPLNQLTAQERARRIGYMPQRFQPHWDITVGELMQMRLEPAASATTQLDVHGLAAFARRRWATLSGGEQARCLLGAVLATDPPVLLADEPGAALDVRHRLDLVHTLAERGRKRLVVVAMHDLELALSHFDRVIVLNQGRVVHDRPPAELLADAALDDVFGVHFERIGAPPDTLLRARRKATETEQGDPHAH